jgi:hypothetical protein
MTIKWIGGNRRSPFDRQQHAIKSDDRPEQEKPEQVGQQAQQSQANAATEPSQCAAPGRRPLFRN